MMRATRGLMSAVLLIAALWPVFTRAEGLKPFLSSGMTYGEVLQAWGPPAERQEFESKREAVWIYDDGRVTFRQGRVLKWQPLPGTRLQREFDLSQKKPLDEREKKPAENDNAVRDILGEIMRESP